MCSCFSIHKCFTVSHMVDCVRLLYTMYRTYNTILHNLGVITVGAAESWDTASGGAGMLLQSQWGSSGAGQEHLEWNRNTIHPLPTGTENHNVFKLAAIFYYRLRHTCTHRYCQSQLCSRVPGTCTRVLATLLTNSVHIFTSHFGSRLYEGDIDNGGFSSH